MNHGKQINQTAQAMQRTRSFYHEGLRRWVDVAYTIGYNRNDRDVWETFVIYWNPERPEDTRVADLDAFFAATSETTAADVRAAHELHRDLARHGIRDHSDFAARVLGRPVDHLRHLSAAERNAVREAMYQPAAMAA